MSNITLSIDDETIKQAKLRAIQEGTSLSAKMRDLLQRYARGRGWAREDLYDRASSGDAASPAAK